MAKAVKTDRKQRLAEQLRANLKKRKAQVRARGAMVEPSPQANGGDKNPDKGSLTPDHKKPHEG